jgi:pimeloyl-ACP methyl ester carboxylesterase
MVASCETLQVNDIEMRYRDLGAGPTLLLLHGFSGSGDDFGHLFDLEVLARSRRLIVPDLRGHGGTLNPRSALTHRACARDVLGLLDHLGVDAVAAIGLSLGGNTLLHVATSAPGRITALVVVSATPALPEGARAIMREEARRVRSPEERAELLERHAGGTSQVDKLLSDLATMADDRDDLAFSAADLGRIHARTLVVSGDRDPLYGIGAAVDLFRGIPDAELWILPGEGHTPVFGSWRESFARTALRFVDG